MRLTVSLIEILLLLFVNLPQASGQNKQEQAKIDSLLTEVPKMTEDTAGVRLLDALAFHYQHINPSQSLAWATRELALAQKIGWRKGQASAYNNFGVYYTDRGTYAEALETLHKAQRIIEELKDTKRISELWLGVGTVYFYQKNYGNALKYYLKSLQAAKTHEDSEWIQIVSGNIGAVYAAQGNVKNALGYLEQAMKIAEAQNDKSGIVMQTGNLATAYANLKQFPKAIAYGFKALRTAEEIGDKTSVAINLGNIGANYYNTARYNVGPQSDSLVPASRTAAFAKGIEYLNKGITACRELNYNRGILMFTAALAAANTLAKTIAKKSVPATSKPRL